jgi:hypothetical protein
MLGAVSRDHFAVGPVTTYPAGPAVICQARICQVRLCRGGAGQASK